MLDIPCILFAGGKSSRMGEDKSLLPFPPNKTLTQFQFQRLSKIFNNVYISCKNRSKFDFEASFIEDITTDNLYAPTAGFVSTFRELECERIFVLSVDSPFVDEETIQKLVESDKNSFDATIAKIQSGIQPMCGVYHRSLQKDFEEMLKNDNHKLGLLLKKSETKYVNFDDNSVFLNMNNQDEYKEALTLVSL